MVIQTPNLTWNGRLSILNLYNVKHIAIHHTAHPTWNVYQTHNYHQKYNNWIGIGYNFFIEKDGTIWECRGLNKGAGIVAPRRKL